MTDREEKPIASKLSDDFVATFSQRRRSSVRRLLGHIARASLDGDNCYAISSAPQCGSARRAGAHSQRPKALSLAAAATEQLPPRSAAAMHYHCWPIS